jgi:hypothetical protein
MKRLVFLTLLLPFFASAANFWWFERVDQELKNSPILKEFNYSALTPQSASFTFKYDSRLISAWVGFGWGQEAVFGFQDLKDQPSYATLIDGKWVIGQEAMMDVMQKLHRRGNLTAGNKKTSATVSQDKNIIELVSQIENTAADLTVLKAKNTDSVIDGIFLTISLRGVTSSEEAQKILRELRPVVERQIEF